MTSVSLNGAASMTSVQFLHFQRRMLGTSQPMTPATRGSHVRSTLWHHGIRFQKDRSCQTAHEINEGHSSLWGSIIMEKDDDNSDWSTSSSDQDKTTAAEDEKQLEIATGETRAIRVSKVCVFIFLLLSATAVGFTAFQFSRNDEQSNFEGEVSTKKKILLMILIIDSPTCTVSEFRTRNLDHCQRQCQENLCGRPIHVDGHYIGSPVQQLDVSLCHVASFSTTCGGQFGTVGRRVSVCGAPTDFQSTRRVERVRGRQPSLVGRSLGVAGERTPQTRRATARAQ